MNTNNKTSIYLTGLFITVCLFLGFTPKSFAQNFTVSGIVTDASTGKPLPSVNILIKGTSMGTITDVNGHYQLSVPNPGSDTLRFSFIGFSTKFVPVNRRTQINIQLKPTLVMGKQLVVVGFGTKQKSNVTGAVASVEVQNLKTQPTGSAVKALQGNVSGVTIITSGQPGVPANIHIRGLNSFGDNSPLYIVDGVPTKSIQALNPQIIASMSVLKGAAAASIYGSRASNGVIVITTKKGEKGELQVHYNAYGGFSVPPQGNVMHLANTKETAQIFWNALVNSGIKPSSATLPQFFNPEHPNRPSIPAYIDPTGIFDPNSPAVDPSKYFIIPNYKDPSMLNKFYYITPASVPGTDWFHALFSPGVVMNHNITVSGGGDLGTFLFAANYRYNAGNIPNQYLKQYSLRVNSNFSIGNHIQIGENLSYSITNNPTVLSQSAQSLIGDVYQMNTVIPVYDIMGNFAGTHGGGLGNVNNGILLAHRNRNDKAQTNKLFGNVFAIVDLWNNKISIKSSFGGSYINNFGHSFKYPEYTATENDAISAFTRYTNQNFNYTWSNTLHYKQSFNGSHNLDLLLGVVAHKNRSTGQRGRVNNFFSYKPTFVSLSSGSGSKTISSHYREVTLFSLFGRLNYNYKQKYLVSFTLRRDGSSKFLRNRYGLFPAGSIGWRISSESFFHIPWIDNLLIRAGYGVMGNQLNVVPSNSFTLYDNSQTSAYYAIKGSNNASQQGFRKVSIGNPDATWEKDKNFNIGINADFLNGRLSLKASYYRKKITGLLYNPPLPGTAGGANPPFVNVGSMENTGLDIALSTVDQITPNLQFTGGVTFTSYNNKIEKISRLVKFFGQASRRFSGSFIVRNAVGHPVSSFYGYKVIGFWDSQDVINKLNSKVQQTTGNPDAFYQKQAAPGRFRYKDVNDDGRITTEDRTFIGNPNPNFTYGINLGFKYKGIDFSMFWYGSQGNDIWYQGKYFHAFMSTFKGSKFKGLLYDSWTPQNHNAKFPIVEVNPSFSTSAVPNSFYIENGSYLRLKNVEIGYTLPVTLLKSTGVRKVRIYLKAANLLTITPYPGIDPEVSFFSGSNRTTGFQGSGSSTSYGIDVANFPTMRKYIIGINLAF